ncbi:NF-kappa-B inhibitor delta-like isoform X3 [Serinus canaria]|uniref:NF-kappa-B inhibitor delta-like isoform X3 n=1 Tax=Serinus canaria TaxID=9135 RepID=UPI0021CCBE10|nr:NF-kappa-B inhibitor delta-like isoform X3 [Serinus canaria]
MRPQRGPPRAAPPQTVKQLLKELRQQKSREGARSPVLALPSPRPSDGAPWPVVPAVTPGLCAVPHVSHGSPGGAHGGRASAPRGFQAAAIPGPAWPHSTVPWGECGASLLGREIQDPYPEPQELAAARAALGGRDPRELLRQDEEGDTLLHVLCAGGQWALARAAAEALRDLGGLEVREHLGKTPLLVAAAAAAPEIVRDLLVLGANPDAADHRGRTALHLAAAYGHPEILQAMMSSGVPVNVEARNFEGQTPLHCAVLAHNASLHGGHSPVGGSGGGSPTPQDRFRCVELLLQMGADSSSQDTKSSLTALHLAVRGGNFALAHLLLRQPGMAPRLVNMKAHGNTPLHMAAALPGTPSQEPLVRLLLAWGADPSARNLEHDLPQSLLPPGALGDQVRPQITLTPSTIPCTPLRPKTSC